MLEPALFALVAARSSLKALGTFTLVRGITTVGLLVDGLFVADESVVPDEILPPPASEFRFFSETFFSLSTFDEETGAAGLRKVLVSVGASTISFFTLVTSFDSFIVFDAVFELCFFVEDWVSGVLTSFGVDVVVVVCNSGGKGSPLRL